MGVVAEGTLVQALKLGQVLNLNYQLKTETNDGGVVGVVAEGTLVQALKLGQVLNLYYQLKTETQNVP